MQAFIEAKQTELESLCRRYHVRRLELFGSAAAGDFEPETSDLDFLVDFEELDPPAYADAYFGLQESLTALYQRPVDLVIPGAVHNPYFLRSIERSRALLYAA
jgi:predicted nucleotidyltransferase